MEESQKFERVQSIDSFRGLTIVFMVFYSLLALFSRELPFLLDHNWNDLFHLGDMVLPSFVFASGMSLVFFARKWGSRSKKKLWKNVLRKSLKLVIVWMPLSFFSSHKLFGFDEIMLNILLFIPSMVVINASDRFIAGISIGILSIHLILQETGYLPDFTQTYLGGIQGVLFYWPLMLGGVLAGRHLNSLKSIFCIYTFATAFLVLFSPPHKMNLTPSYITFSVAFTTAGFMLMRNTTFAPLIYLGKKPLRYWIMMFVLFLIPVKSYCILLGDHIYRMPFSWQTSLLLSSGAVVIIYYASLLYDYAMAELEKLEESRKQKDAS